MSGWVSTVRPRRVLSPDAGNDAARRPYALVRYCLAAAEGGVSIPYPSHPNVRQLRRPTHHRFSPLCCHAFKG